MTGTGNGGDWDAGALDLIGLIGDTRRRTAEGRLQDHSRARATSRTCPMPPRHRRRSGQGRGRRETSTSRRSRCRTSPTVVRVRAHVGWRSSTLDRSRWSASRRLHRLAPTVTARRPTASHGDRWPACPRCMPDHASDDPRCRRPATPSRRPAHLGPQGRVGQFVVECTLQPHRSRRPDRATPDMPGMSHSHDFFGNDDHRRRAPRCDRPARAARPPAQNQQDTAAYWAADPARRRRAGARPGWAPPTTGRRPGVDPTDVEPYPVRVQDDRRRP